MNDLLFFRPNEDFHLFGSQHLMMMAIIIAVGIGMSAFGKKHLSAADQIRLGRGITLVLAAAVLGWIGIRIALGQFDYKTDLPFDICNIVALALPFLMWNPKHQVQEVLYFWVMAGTIQAILTPHLFEGFPHFTFIKYFTVHGGLVVYAVYATVVFGLRPTWRSLWRAFLALQVYIVLLFLVNLLLGSNYAYLMGKPPTASAFDYLGDYPWYLLVSEGLALVLFVLVLLPVLPRKRKAEA
jgi:hypothetical integral membrane protein (TIGR02206 family)